MRHIEVNQPWVQDKVYIGEITLNKRGTAENMSDALTKAVDAENLSYHVNNGSAGRRRDRHWMAPEMTKDHAVENTDREDGSEQERWLESVATTGKP